MCPELAQGISVIHARLDWLRYLPGLVYCRYGGWGNLDQGLILLSDIGVPSLPVGSQLLAVANSSVRSLSDLPTSPMASSRVWAKAGLPWSSDRPVSQASSEVIRLWLDLLAAHPWHVASWSAPCFSLRPALTPVRTLSLLAWLVSFAFRPGRPVTVRLVFPELSWPNLLKGLPRLPVLGPNCPGLAGTLHAPAQASARSCPLIV